MTYQIILAALVLGPVVAIWLLRANGAVAYMSLGLGSLLVAYTTSDVTAVFGSLSPKGLATTNQWLRLGLLLAPLLLTVWITRGNVRGGKQLLNLLPALATGLLLGLLGVPLLPTDAQHHIHSQPAWKQLVDLQTAVLLGGTALSLLVLQLRRPRKLGDEPKKKHGK